MHFFLLLFGHTMHHFCLVRQCNWHNSRISYDEVHHQSPQASFLDAIASPSTYPMGQWVSGSVSEWFIVSDLEIAIASPSFASFFLNVKLSSIGQKITCALKFRFVCVSNHSTLYLTSLASLTETYILCCHEKGQYQSLNMVHCKSF